MLQPRASAPVLLNRRGFLRSGALLASACTVAKCGCALAAEADARGQVPSASAPTGPGYTVEPMGGELYWVSDGAYNTMFAVSSAGVIACDAPPTLGLNYLKAIRQVTDKPVTHLVYSHEHVDHIAGASSFPQGIHIVANRRTADLLASRRDPRRPLPSIVFDERYTLSVGDQTLELSWHGINHSIDNTFIYAPRQRVLMLIDVVYPGWMPYKNLGVAVDVPGFVDAHRQALKFDFNTLVAGHVSRLGQRVDVETQLEFLRDLAEACDRAYSALTFPAFLASRPGTAPSWDRHKDYEDALTDRVAAEVGPQWRGRLQGFDTYFRDNCWAMLESLVVQGRPHFE